MSSLTIHYLHCPTETPELVISRVALAEAPSVIGLISIISIRDVILCPWDGLELGWKIFQIFLQEHLDNVIELKMCCLKQTVKYVISTSAIWHKMVRVSYWQCEEAGQPWWQSFCQKKALLRYLSNFHQSINQLVLTYSRNVEYKTFLSNGKDKPVDRNCCNTPRQTLIDQLIHCSNIFQKCRILYLPKNGKD